MENLVSILILKGKAYIPTDAKIRGDGHLAVEPIYVTALNVRDLTATIEQKLAAGEEEIAMPSREEFKRRKDPILAATKLKSWKALARDAFSYTIDWHNEAITLYLHALDEKGRFTTTPERTVTYPTGTLISTMVEAILADATRIELEIIKMQADDIQIQ